MIMEKIPLWEDRDDVFLHTLLREYIPNPMSPNGAGPMPAVLICPGGAYMFCSVDLEGDTTALDFIRAGYQTFILEYRIGSRCPVGEAAHPAQLLDLGRAMLTIRENAEKWHVDPERIALAGFSAGGNLVGNMATMWHKSLLSDYFGVPSEYFRPMGVIMGYPITDYRYQEEYNLSLLPNTMMLQGRETLFGTMEPTEEQLLELSPCYNVTEKTPPVFLVHAQNDTLVPAVNSLKMAAALAEAGVDYELHIFKRGEHGFADGVPGGVEPFRQDRHLPAAAWMPMAERWLMNLAAPETDRVDPCVAEGMRAGARARLAAEQAGE